MSDELQDPNKGRPGARHLRPEEREIVLTLLKHSPSYLRLADTLDAMSVADMDDGEMGSIKFLVPVDDNRRLGFELCSATYTDRDGVPVSIALNLDQFGELFELDIWKVDFSPLIRYPTSQELKIVPTASG